MAPRGYCVIVGAMMFPNLVVFTIREHYQKIAKYQRTYRRNFFCRYFSAEITDGKYSSVITDRKFRINEKRAGSGAEVLAGDFADGITDGIKNWGPYA